MVIFRSYLVRLPECKPYLKKKVPCHSPSTISSQLQMRCRCVMGLGLGKKGRELLHQNLAMGAEVAKSDHQNANFTWENRVI